MGAHDRLVFRLKGKRGHVDGSRFSDVDLATVPERAILLDLAGADVSDTGVETLPELPALRCIDLDNTRITDAAMERLGKLRSLEEIWIEGTAVSDRGLTALHGLAKLKFISIVDCENVSDEAVAELRKAIPGVEVH